MTATGEDGQEYIIVMGDEDGTPSVDQGKGLTGGEESQQVVLTQEQLEQLGLTGEEGDNVVRPVVKIQHVSRPTHEFCYAYLAVCPLTLITRLIYEKQVSKKPVRVLGNVLDFLHVSLRPVVKIPINPDLHFGHEFLK